MGVHLGIYACVFVVFLVMRKKKGGRHREEEKKGYRLFLLLAVLGNTLGLFLTLYGEAQRPLASLPRREAAYTETVEVDLGGETARISLMIPPRRGESTEEEARASLPYEEEEGQGEKLQALKAYIAACNEEDEEANVYLLPAWWEGEQLLYLREGSGSGKCLAFFCLGAGFLAFLLSGQEEEKKKRERQDEMLQAYPGLLMQFTLMLWAGLSTRRAFERVARDYQRSGKKAEVYDYLVLCCREMEAGCSEAEAYERFADRCGHHRYRTLAMLLEQNLRSGGQALTELLERESMEAWEERRRKARVQGEKVSTKLLLPMGLLLLLVLGLILLPAFLSI